MKRLLILVLLFLSCINVEKTGAELLLERLIALKQKGYMFGHQDDPFYGLTWEW